MCKPLLRSQRLLAILMFGVVLLLSGCSSDVKSKTTLGSKSAGATPTGTTGTTGTNTSSTAGKVAPTPTPRMGAITPVPAELIHGVSADRWNRANVHAALPAVSELPSDSQYLPWSGYLAIPTENKLQVLISYGGCQEPSATQTIETTTQIKVGVQTKKSPPGEICPAIAQEAIVIVQLNSEVGDRSVVALGP